MFREKFSIEYNIPHSKVALYLAPELFLKYKNETFILTECAIQLAVNTN
jgi:hypothetical protein